MARKIPFVATAIVLAAIASMIGLGVWQIQRASWKEALLAQYEANRNRAPVALPTGTADIEPLLFRRATAICLQPAPVSPTSGRNMAGTSGWSYVAYCRADDPRRAGLSVDIGWSTSFDAATNWQGGAVEGVIVPTGKNGIKLFATTPAPGLEASQPPGPDTISNNHRFYAAQWFFFAAVAGLIYWLALRRRGAPHPAETRSE